MLKASDSLYDYVKDSLKTAVENTLDSIRKEREAEATRARQREEEERREAEVQKELGKFDLYRSKREKDELVRVRNVFTRNGTVMVWYGKLTGDQGYDDVPYQEFLDTYEGFIMDPVDGHVYTEKKDPTYVAQILRVENDAVTFRTKPATFKIWGHDTTTLAADEFKEKYVFDHVPKKKKAKERKVKPVVRYVSRQGHGARILCRKRFGKQRRSAVFCKMELLRREGRGIV